MKKTVTHLNSQERKYFEEIYQCLENYPDWRMENIFINKTPEHNEFEIFPLKFYARDKNTRLSVSAHEAGHAIVMAASYGVVGEAVIDIKDHPDGLLGWVRPFEHKNASDHQPKVQEGMPCKPAVIRDIIIKSGGFVGESFVGKKTGANHERFLVYCRCRHLDKIDEVESLTNWSHYVDWCRKIILNNESLFWRIIDDLLANSELTDSCKTLLHRSIKKEPTELFF